MCITTLGGGEGIISDSRLGLPSFSHHTAAIILRQRTFVMSLRLFANVINLFVNYFFQLYFMIWQLQMFIWLFPCSNRKYLLIWCRTVLLTLPRKWEEISKHFRSVFLCMYILQLQKELCLKKHESRGNTLNSSTFFFLIHQIYSSTSWNPNQ